MVDLDYFELLEKNNNPDIKLKKIFKLLFLLQNKFVPFTSSNKFWPYCLAFLKLYKNNLGQ